MADMGNGSSGRHFKPSGNAPGSYGREEDFGAAVGPSAILPPPTDVEDMALRAHMGQRARMAPPIRMVPPIRMGLPTRLMGLLTSPPMALRPARVRPASPLESARRLRSLSWAFSSRL